MVICMKITSIISLFVLLLPCYSQAQNANNKVVINLWNDVGRLNPITSTSADASYVEDNVFSSLLEYNPKNYQLQTDLATALPTIATIDTGFYKGGMSLTFEINKNAVWDNGQPITAHDFIFTVKAIKNPRIEAGSNRPYYTFINDIKIDKANERKFTIYSKERYFLAENSAGTLQIMPEYIYDSSRIMRKFNIGDLDTIPQMKSHNQIIKFAEQFNKLEFSNFTLTGSGAYRFESWKFQDKIVLVRKKDYWKDKVENPNNKAKYPDTIVYKIAQSFESLQNAAKNGEIDAISGVQPQTFDNWKKDAVIKANFNFHTPEQFAYDYIGINTKKAGLSEKKVRQALAYLIDKQYLINTIYKGYAKSTNSPINPVKTHYHKGLKEREFNLKQAKTLLTEAGWVDTDSNGILDKTIEGKKIELKFNVKFLKNNQLRKEIAQHFQTNAQKVGISLELNGEDRSTLMENLNSRKYDLNVGAWIQTPDLEDMTQLWHSSSDHYNGSNRTGFGNAQSDKIIDEIRVCVDKKQRNLLYKEIQTLIADEQPYIFLCVPKERLIIHKKFSHTQVTANRPNFIPSEFQTK